jgi:5-methylthioadenosine/S-adenosylhomocysteine deaminase
MPTVDHVLAARWVIPVQPSGLVLEDHAVALSGTSIAAVLPIAQARQQYADAQWTLLPEHILTPGLINAHTHAAMSLLRGVGDDMPLMGRRAVPICISFRSRPRADYAPPACAR